MPARFLPLPLALLIAACGASDDTPAAEEAAGTAAAQAGGGSAALTAGRWKVDSTIAGMDQQQTEYLCITPEQAGSGRFLLGELPDGCTVERDSMAGGRIDFALRCGQLTSTFAGTYDATSYRTEATVDLGTGTPMRATSTGTFEGAECQADDVRLQVD